MLLYSHIYSVERGKLTPEDVIVTESGTLEPEEERMFTVSLTSLVSLYFIFGEYVLSIILQLLIENIIWVGMFNNHN